MSTLFDPIAQARAAGAAAIESPICNGPFVEPTCFWQVVDFKTGERTEPTLKEGRRPAGYFFAPRGSKYESATLEEEFVPLDAVNEIRRRVREWRKDGYRGVTPVTRALLEYWSTGRETPLFFCQLEAVETLIWLHEAHPADRQGITVTVDSPSPLRGEGVRGVGSSANQQANTPTGQHTVPLDAAHESFRRYCAKMATGTGKTVVMAMLVAWSTLNKAHYPQDTRFSDAVLIVAPGVTVKERLGVLVPGTPSNYYDQFSLVPNAYRDHLRAARIHILHRQEMAVKDDTKKRGVQKLGVESDAAFANRLLKRALGSKQRLLVLNDEGHHCYRPRIKELPLEELKQLELYEGPITKEDKEESVRAAQWITGLEKIHAARGILTCIDLSATPFYIHGSGYPVGRPFPWIVSDFGLVDAIESGLVKIPQIPVDDDLGGNPPAYFHLWRWINERLPAADKETARRKAKPEAVVREAEPALITMIGNWVQEYESWREQGWSIPPVLIVVTQDTSLSQLLFERLTREDFEFREFVNADGQQVSYLYDSKQFDKVEEGETGKEAEARLRSIMNSVGKEGQPGQHVRCIVSVSMLTEGWDANNVTQIVGLRGFTSQLLCEQVVGRALRRRRYDQFDENGFLVPEYADVYGVPFQVIPVKAKQGNSPNPPPASTLIRSLPEREALAIEFPRVEGYLTEIRDAVVCDFDTVPYLNIAASGQPTEVYVKGAAGYRIGRPDIGGPGILERHDRLPYYLLSRVNTACFSIAARILQIRIPGTSEIESVRRRNLFPQVLEIVRRYVSEFIVFDDVPHEEIGLDLWQEKIVNVLNEAIAERGEEGEPIFLPRIERFRPFGSTGEVMFRTGRDVRETLKSHVSHVVLDSPIWESQVVQVLENSPVVESYVRNDHLDFTIPYVDTVGDSRHHYPDFIVRMISGLHVALEVKGQMREDDQVKILAGIRWADAVNRYFGERVWVYHPCFHPPSLDSDLLNLSTSAG